MKEKDFGEELMAADQGKTTRNVERDKMFEMMIEREIAHEKNLRRLALVTWSVAITCVLILGVCIFMLRSTFGVYPDPTLQEIMRMFILIFGAAGGLSLVIAFLATLRWMFRSRTPSLSVIERRLASMEDVLREKN